MSSWILKPGAIEHIPHCWQPTSNWVLGLDFLVQAIQSLIDVIEGRNVLASDVTYMWTSKVDDAVSIRVGKIGDSYGVAYKTASNVFLDAQQVVSQYSDKPFLRDKLLAVLRIAPTLFPRWEHDVSMQVGVLYADLQNTVPSTFKSNVTEFTLSYVPTRAMIALVPVLKVLHRKDGTVGSMGQDMIDYNALNRNFDVVHYDPRLFLNETAKRHIEVLRSYKILLKRMISKNLENLAFGEKHHVVIQRYLNHLVRNQKTLVLDTAVADFVKFFASLEATEILKLKTQKGRLARTEKFTAAVQELVTNSTALEDVFDAVLLLKDFRDCVLKMFNECAKDNSIVQSPRSEGVVVTAPVSFGQTLGAFKFVDEKFSFNNFQQNDGVIYEEEKLNTRSDNAC